MHHFSAKHSPWHLDICLKLKSLSTLLNMWCLLNWWLCCLKWFSPQTFLKGNASHSSLLSNNFVGCKITNAVILYSQKALSSFVNCKIKIQPHFRTSDLFFLFSGMEFLFYFYMSLRVTELIWYWNGRRWLNPFRIQAARQIHK